MHMRVHLPTVGPHTLDICTRRGTLLDLGIMEKAQVSEVRVDAASVENFFSSVCAPG